MIVWLEDPSWRRVNTVLHDATLVLLERVLRQFVRVSSGRWPWFPMAAPNPEIWAAIGRNNMGLLQVANEEVTHP